MANKLSVLVDLNIIIDVVQQRQPFYVQSARVLDAMARETAVGFVAAHSITTLFYVISRLRDRAVAVTAVTTLLDAFKVAAVDDAVIRHALGWGWPEFEDAVQMGAALNAGADYLVTRNPRDFKSGPVPVLEPAALLALLSAT